MKALIEYLQKLEPNPRQVEFFSANARHVAYGGARGGGKSWSMRVKFILLAIQYPGLKLLLLRRTLPELRENHVIPLQGILYGFAKYKDSEKAFIFPNGSRIKLGYCDNDSDVYQFQGQEYDVIGLEEATHFTDAMRMFFTTCNRSTRTDFSPRMYYTSNPGGIGHSWFKRLFVDREYVGKEKESDYVFIPAKVYDNTVLMEANPEYVEALENLPEDLRKAHLDGDWNIWSGQMFSEFRTDKHVIQPFDIPPEWRRFRSIDYGYNDYTAVYWYAVSDQHIYVYRELWIRQTLASELARMIVELSEDENIEYTVASPDMWQKRGGWVPTTSDPTLGESIAETFSLCGVTCIPADNSRIIGWQRVHEALEDSPDGKPYLQIFNTCRALTKHLPQLAYDDNKPEDAATEPHEFTDTTDSLRYGLMSRPRARSMEKQLDLGKLSPDCLADYMKADPSTRRYLAKKWGILK